MITTTAHGAHRRARLVRVLALSLLLAGSVSYRSLQAAGSLAAPPAVTLPESIPDFSADPFRTEIQSLQTGNWSSASTWVGGVVPTLNHVVRVALGHTVTIADTTAVAYTIVVDGKLRFDPTVNTRVMVTNFQVMAGEMGMGTRGELEVGTATTPIAAGVTAEIVIANTALGGGVADPFQYGTGLIVFGKATMHGSPRTPTFVRVAAEPRAGDNTLLLSEAVSGWRVGDRIVLPDTRHIKESEVTGGGWVNAVNQWEERTVQAISGTTVTLSSPLQYDHLGARDLNGVLEPGFLPHVGNLTRNVIIRSENPNGTRGHTLSTHVADVDMRYVLFKDLGRTKYVPLNTTTNHIGRYPVHMHHLAGPLPTPSNGYQFTLLGNAIDGGSAETQFKWGIAIHGSHYGLIQDNVIYNMNGASVATEDGSESFNVFDHNFALRGMGQPDEVNPPVQARSAMGTEGVGFWFRGPNNYVRNNVAANFQNSTTEAAYGYVYQFKSLGDIRVPDSKGADTFMGTSGSTLVNGNSLKLLEFAKNEAYGAMQGGFTYWWISSLDPLPVANAQESIVKDLKLWNIYNKNVYMYPGQKVTFDGLIIRGSYDDNNRCCGDGVYAADYASKEIIIRNASIQGMKSGIIAPMAGTGTAPNLTIQDTYLRNITNVSVPINGSVNGCWWLNDKLVTIINTEFAAVPGRGVTNLAMVGDVANVGNPATLPACMAKLNQLKVYSYNGVATDNFQLYHPSATVPPRPPLACTTETRPGFVGLVCPIPALGPIAPSAVLNASPTTAIPLGTPATLTWSTVNAVTVALDQGIGALTYAGSVSVSPLTTTTYTLTATNDIGTVTDTAVVTVGPPDSIAPVISGVASSVTSDTATITFSTDEPARPQVQYGLTAAYGTTSPLGATLLTNHSVVLTGLTPGTLYHYRALATDLSSNVATSGDLTFTTGAAAIAVGAVVSANGTNTVSTGPLNTTAASLVMAFAASSGPDAAGAQSLTISGGGLAWTRVTQASGMPGVAEIWKASSPTALTGISVTSTQSAIMNFAQSLTVVTFPGASGVGASLGASSEPSAPTVSLTATQPGSSFYAVGNDWYGAVARTLGPNQSMDHEWLSTATGDTYWVQHLNGAGGAVGSVIQLNDTAPTNHRWNFAGVEILAKTTPVITWPTPANIVLGTALGPAQLNATTTVPGTFTYSPPIGTVLGLGAGQALSTTFTPTDLAAHNPASATVAITVLSLPTVATISPSLGPASGGTAVTITGSGFTAGATVTIGGVAASSVVVANATTITAVTGARAAGVVSVVVTNADAQTGTLNGFTYVAAPTVTAISPTSGPAVGGTAVTITGTGFTAGATVTIGGVAASSVVVSNATTITATTGAHAAGAVNVVVTNGDAQTGTLAGGFTYVAAPTVTAISPAIGAASGGTAVAITGTGFASGATVAIGGVPAAAVVVVNATTVTAVTGAHATGAVDVAVTNPDQQAGTWPGGYTYANPPAPTASPSRLNFGVTKAPGGGPIVNTTAPQIITALLNWVDSPVWTAAPNQPWLQVTSGPSASQFVVAIINPNNVIGASTVLTGAVTMSAPNLGISVTVPVTLRMTTVGSSTPPFGSFDTPITGPTPVSGSIGVTGWALDDIGVQRVEIWRDPIAGETTPPYAGPGLGTGKIFIADALFVDGSRPDVEAAYPNNPQDYRAGWGYLMLTQGLANQGNGVFTLHAIAYDNDGHSLLLGSKTIVVDNANAVKPFGALDSPGLGAMASGFYWNFGWALTPGPACTIGPAGVQMAIDSGPLLPVNYGDLRLDIAGAFPGFTNGAGAGGAYLIDTRSLANGTHQIGWFVTDNCGRQEGIGSRFFSVLNSNAANAAPAFHSVTAVTPGSNWDPIQVQRNDLASQWSYPNLDGVRVVRVAQGERVELHLPAQGSAGYSGYQVVKGERRSLPLGSSLDGGAGVYYWQPAAGFLGSHDLEFVDDRAPGGSTLIGVRVVVGPSMRLVVDTPQARATVAESFVVAGWVLDLAAQDGAGVDAVHVWAYRVRDEAAQDPDPIFVGAADYGGTRPDVGAVYGRPFDASAYDLTVRGLPPGTYDLVVYARMTATGTFDAAQVVRVTIQ